MADDTSEALKIWEALRPMIDTEIAEKTRSCVRTRKMVCTTAPNGSVIGVAEPFGNEVKIPYSSSVSNAQVGDAVWVQWYYDNASTMLAISFGDGSSQEYLPLTGGTVTGSITSTRNGFGFYSNAASSVAGFLASNTTTGMGVTMQVNATGANRGIYDYSGRKWMAYCDSNDALRFAGVTNATKGDLGIDDLENALGAIKFIRKALAGHGNITYTFTGDCRYIILYTGYQASLCGIIFGTCTSSGGIYVAGRINAGSSNTITTTSETYKLTLSNSGGSQSNTVMIIVSGTAPTVA